ncbi:TOMM precursor leader peptide-binding protein [Streptomyces aidingensis]|uniref:Ribosomal protein S12 methylthiotransferase accessory factor n=1 Tax=Streptomyces aidingensis TaxID=910347 RepID=A0A1I1QZ79_9ACTN|nr:TOMM precursor leader peptide-binding protein [Streptomyces aidingensis]SFD27277.1 ribosomal protein S12 methylthiotransferase accessory factor [Streptomyces aidingensis]
MTAGVIDHSTATGNDQVVIGFKSHLQATVVPGEAAYLVSPEGVTALRGRPAEVLAPLLDGTRTLRAVLEAAAPRLSPADVVGALRSLDAAGLLRTRREPAGGHTCPPTGPPAGECHAGAASGHPADPAAEAYWDLVGLPDGGACRLAAATVRIVNLAAADPGPLRDACRESGVTVLEDGDGGGGRGGEADLSLVLCDDYLLPELAGVDERHRAAGRPWLLAKLSGRVPWVGPLFQPDGACWHCLAVRLGGHRAAEQPLRRALRLTGPLPRPEASLAAGRAMAQHAAVLETAKWLAGMRYPGQHEIHSVDTLNLRTVNHPVTRRPQCGHCGDPGMVARTVRTPFVVRSRPKAADPGNGHRAARAEEVLGRYGHLVDSVTGVVAELRRDPRAPEFVHSYVSGPNLAVGSRTLAGVRAGLRALSGGKGNTDTEARTSALCEALERYCGVRHGDEPVVRDSLRGLGEAAVHPNDCQLFDDRQFAAREQWNTAYPSPFHHVPPRFDPDRVCEWTPVWSLTGGRRRLLPTELLYYASPAQQQAAAATTAAAGGSGGSGDGVGSGLRADSNGNGAGASPEDALVQAFLELVERDAVALWWYNRTRQPALDLDAFGEPAVARVAEGCRRGGRELWALDLTSDFGIPVVAVVSRRTDKPAEDIVFGFGAHFDPRVALRRAVTEMAQLLPSVWHVRPDGTGYGVQDPETRAWWTGETVARQPYLTPDPGAAPRTPDDWHYRPRADLRDDIAAITGLLDARGLELLVLDQTRPDIGLPVVKVLVPGLRHFWARFAPGRLFDVPVALGRLAEPTAYQQLNPIPLFV